MSDGALFKPDKDFSKEADKVIPEAEALAKVRCQPNPRRDDIADCLVERHPEGY